jgi:hypothetical protein
MGVPVGIPEQQQLTSSMGPATVRLKSPFNQSFPNQQTYYNGNATNNRNQNYGYNVQSNDCFVANANPNRSIANQTNVFVEQDEFRAANQNSAGYICNTIKNNVPSQPCSGNAVMNQHHHMACGNMMPQNHPLNAAQQPHLPIVTQQQSHQKQFQPQHQHQMVNQQNNFQPMRVIPNHQHHHHVHHHQHGNSAAVMHNAINPIDGGKQIVPNGEFITQQEKSDKTMYEHPCEMNVNTQCRPPRNGNSFCNCYHMESGHVHQPSPQLLQQSQSQNSCMTDCSSNCSSVIVQNAQGQQIIMQPNHHIVAQDMQPQMMHHQALQQHHPHVHNQMQPSANQVYTHHLHHHQSPPGQQQTQAQQMYIMQQHQHQQQQQQQQQQMQMMQTQNQNDDMKTGQNRCGQMMHVQMNGNPNNHGHMNSMMAQRHPIMWQQKNVQHAAVNTSHNVVQCSETTSASSSSPNPFERVPPLHSHMSPSPPVWNEDQNRKRMMKNPNKSPTAMGAKKMKMPFGQNYQDGRTVNQTSGNAAGVSSTNTNSAMAKDKNDYSNTPVPSFMDDPSGYLAQQTALLNSTISKQTGENPSSKERSSCYSQSKTASTLSNPLMKSESGRTNMYKVDESKSRLPQAKTPDSSVQIDSQYMQCSQNVPQRKNSAPNSTTFSHKVHQNRQHQLLEDNPVTSSTYDRERNASLSPSDSRSPIQAGTVSTSNQSPVQPGMASPNNNCGASSANYDMLPQSPAVVRTVRENDSPVTIIDSPRSVGQCAVTTVVSGHTCSSNTITSVLAGRTNTAVVSTNNTAPQNSPPPSRVATAGSTSSNSSSGSEDNDIG